MLSTFYIPVKRFLSRSFIFLENIRRCMLYSSSQWLVYLMQFLSLMERTNENLRTNQSLFSVSVTWNKWSLSGMNVPDDYKCWHAIKGRRRIWFVVWKYICYYAREIIKQIKGWFLCNQKNLHINIWYQRKFDLHTLNFF